MSIDLFNERGLDGDWYIVCECVDCPCQQYVRINQADEDGDYLRLCNDCMFGEHKFDL